MSYIVIALSILALELLYFRIADRFNIIDKPSERGSSKDVTLRGGGIVFFLGALVYFVYSGWQYPWFIAGLTLVSVVSFWDDVRSLSPRFRLLMQFTGMLLMFYQLGMFTADRWWMIAVALVVCTGAMNIFNFMDGINGITGGYALVVLAALGYVDMRVTQFVDVRFIFITAIAVAVFCFFNFRTKAKCFAGDIGSVSVAFILLFYIGRLVLHTQDLSWCAFLAVYGVDGCLTIIHRLMLHENVSLPHRKHAYQIMANELRIPHVAVSLIYMSIQGIVCICFILSPRYPTFLLIVTVLVVMYILFMKKYFRLHQTGRRQIS